MKQSKYFSKKTQGGGREGHIGSLVFAGDISLFGVFVFVLVEVIPGVVLQCLSHPQTQLFKWRCIIASVLGAALAFVGDQGITTTNNNDNHNIY